MNPLRIAPCVVFLVTVLAACSASRPQTDANSNWLRECSAARDCASDQLCACGVCTIACVSDDSCQNAAAPDAHCVSVADAQCAGPSKGAVCTADCTRDSQCGGGELSCVEHSCVLTRAASNEPDRDAMVDGDAGANPLEPDTGIVGPPRPQLGCGQGPACEDGYACSHEQCRRLWSGNGCEPAAETRPACDSDADCAQGTVCHVDGTCIEPGKCDRFGMTTLASLGDIGAMVVAKDSVFVLERGSEDALGNHRSDGAIKRVAIADGELQTVVGNIYRPLDLKVDSERVYWRQGVRGELAFDWADRADGGNRVSLPLEGAIDAGWVLGPDYIYALISKRMDLFDLFRIAKGTSTLEHLNDNSAVQPGMSIDSEYLYFDDTERWSLADNMLLGSTELSRFASDPSFIDGERIFHMWDSDPNWLVGYMRKDDSRQITLAEFPSPAGGIQTYWVKAYRDHVYFAYGRPIDDPRVPMDSVVQRAPIIPGEVETVALLADGSHLADISDQGLFSIQGHRLVRQVIDDYARGPSPAQGAAQAPCFGDQTCDDGLFCVDAVCSNDPPPEPPPPSCEERLGCDAGFACFREHCQKLWSGNGCEPAPETRPACTTDADCDQGLVCHVDGTCIEPGKCDRFGMTTYASVGDVRAMTVTKDSAFLLDYGSEDALGNHQGDGAIQRVAFADASVQTVVGSLYKPLDMRVDSSRVYWRRGVSGVDQISLGWADRDGSNPGDLPFDASYVYFEWVLSPTDIYALISKPADRYDFFRIAKGTTTLAKLNAETGLLTGTGMGIDSEYVYFDGGHRCSLADGALLDPTPASQFVTIPNFIDREHIYFPLGYVRKDDGALTNLSVGPQDGGDLDGGDLPWLRAYRNHLYFLYGRTDKYWIVARAPLVPGETETLAYLGAGGVLVEVSDQGLFSIQDHRLVRQVIEDYASGPAPAQGATGAPCFGDGACNVGLSCVDALCE